MISIWLCPDSKDKLYLQNIINHLSDIHNSVPFFPHCTLLSGIKLNTSELTTILDKSIDNMGPIIVESKRISYTNIFWKTLFIELSVSKDLISLQKNIFKQIKSNIKYKFEPHISLIYKIMPEYIKKEIIHSLHLQNTYKMNKVMAVRTDQNIVDWKIVAERDLYA
ncbi:MAG: hypothetical protein ACJZ1O_06905 [Candidatus Neomarinimicrobiota bacterium]